MAALGRYNQRLIPLGQGSGDVSDEVINRPYPVIVSAVQTNTQIIIYLDFYVDGIKADNADITGFTASDLLITGLDTTPTPVIVAR